MTTSLYLLLLALWVQGTRDGRYEDYTRVCNACSLLCIIAATIAFAFGK